jgi:hypothetical protein
MPCFERQLLFEIESYVTLLKSLSNGLTLDEISTNFKSTGIVPNGSSSLEKQINRLKYILKPIIMFILSSQRFRISLSF